MIHSTLVAQDNVQIFKSERATIYRIIHPVAGPNLRLPDLQQVWAGYVPWNRYLVPRYDSAPYSPRPSPDGMKILGWVASQTWDGAGASALGLNGQAFWTDGQNFTWMETPENALASFALQADSSGQNIVGAVQTGGVDVVQPNSEGGSAGYVRTLRPVVWDSAGKIRYLPGDSGCAMGISRNGRNIVGFVGEAERTPLQDPYTGPCEACSKVRLNAAMWVDGVLHLLNQGGQDGFAFLVSSDGSVVVGGKNSDSILVGSPTIHGAWVLSGTTYTRLPRMNYRERGYPWGSARPKAIASTGVAIVGYDFGAISPTYPVIWRPGQGSWTKPIPAVITPGVPGEAYSCSSDASVIVGQWSFSDRTRFGIYRSGRGLSSIASYVKDELGIQIDIIEPKSDGFGNCCAGSAEISDDASTIVLSQSWTDQKLPTPSELWIIRLNKVPPERPRLAISIQTVAEQKRLSFTIPGVGRVCRLERRGFEEANWSPVAAFPAEGGEYSVVPDLIGALFRLVCE